MALTRGALAPAASSSAAARGRDALAELARAAAAGDAAAAFAYHELLWDLHADPDRRTYALRGWIAAAGYEVEEATIAPVELAEAHEPAAFAERIRGEQAALSGLVHPMSAHLFAGEPSLDEVKIYLRHHWHRSRLFFRELTELSLARPLAEASVLFRNLYDEGGGEHSDRAHPFLLQRLLRHLGVPCDFDERPALPEARAYLNNRIRCARAANPAWGLAVLYALEAGTPATHGAIYRLLRRLGVPEEACEFHRLHMTADIEHTEETLGLIAALVRGAGDQGIFLASLRHHRGLGRRYFDAIWREIQETRAP
ncbi:MAG: iron-containing redox enzyme family protein [Nannocystis sp.]|nr:iron-containing redox enzyme family protein [Nannocystis sp.]